MSRTKRAFSAFLTATMLVTLTAGAVLGAKSFSSTGSDQTDYLNCGIAITATLDTCSQVADGLSTVTLVGDTGDADGTAEQAIISVAGATIVSSSVGTVSGSTVSVINDETLTGISLILRAPAAAGSGVVTVSTLDASTGVASQEGTLTITFTASSGLQVSEGNSLVKIVANNKCDNNVDADNTGTTSSTILAETAVTNAAASGGTVDLCILVRNASGDPVDAEEVKVTITPVGLVGGSQTQTIDPAADGIAIFDLTGSGVSGTSTISIAIKEANVVTTFGARTFVWSGALATLTLANEKFVGAIGATSVDALKLTGKDSGGNAVTPTGVTWQVTGGTGGVAAPVAGTKADLWSVTCGSGASGTYTITAKSGTVTSNSVTWICSPAQATTDTYTVAFDVANVAPGGATKLCAIVKNTLGQSVPDGSYTTATAIVSSGALGSFSSGTSNGKVCATYLAPFASGQVSAVVTPGGGVDPTSKTAVITIGGSATAAATKAGLDKTCGSGFSTSTKVVPRGQYVTYRFDMGTAAAGTTVGIAAATKTGTAWSGFATVTSRVANSSGIVCYWVRQSTATWKSYRAGQGTAGVTPARQARWT